MTDKIFYDLIKRQPVQNPADYPGQILGKWEVFEAYAQAWGVWHPEEGDFDDRFIWQFSPGGQYTETFGERSCHTTYSLDGPTLRIDNPGRVVCGTLDYRIVCITPRAMILIPPQQRDSRLALRLMLLRL